MRFFGLSKRKSKALCDRPRSDVVVLSVNFAEACVRDGFRLNSQSRAIHNSTQQSSQVKFFGFTIYRSIDLTDLRKSIKQWTCNSQKKYNLTWLIRKKLEREK
jgi:hypothetical protein